MSAAVPLPAGRTPGETILSGGGLVVRAGERVAVLGANGAGKTTLLRALAGLGTHPREGERPASVAPRPRTRTAWVPQEYRESLFPWFSALRNVAMPLLVARAGDALEVARRLCRLLVPHVDPSALAGRLSGGEQQALAIARALAWPADVLLADEPFSAIDPVAKRGVRRATADELAGRALVLVTHDPSDTELCHRVLRLEGGRLVET